MCNDFSLQKWQADAILSLIEIKNIKLSLVILNSSLSNNSTPLFHRFFYRMFKKFFFNPASVKTVDMQSILLKHPIARCKTIRKGRYSEYFTDEDIKTIKSYNLDFIIRFGFNIIRGKILNSARYGIWSYHHGDETFYRGGPPGFWEIYFNDDITGVVFQRLTDKLDAGIILKKGYFKTIKHSYSANVCNIFSSATEWIKQVCIDIQSSIPDIHQFSASSATNAKILTYPNNRQMLYFIYRLLINKIKFHYRELFLAEKWNIGISEQNPYSLLTAKHLNLKWLPKQNGRFYRADPFGIQDSEKLIILYENYDYKKKKGNISACSVDSTISIKNKVPLTDCQLTLTKPYHLAYPYIFRHENDYYCLPESSENNSIDLYKIKICKSSANNKLNETCNKSSNTFKTNTDNICFTYIKTLINNIDAVDPTLFFYNGLWWLFFTRKKYDSNTCLFGYFSESLDGEYIPHRNNPIKTDISSARPAGTPFNIDGKLYRPSQDCSIVYGGALKINMITKLNPEEFREITVNIIEPNKKSYFNNGIHTISLSGKYMIADGKRLFFSPYNFLHQLKRKFNKITNK